MITKAETIEKGMPVLIEQESPFVGTGQGSMSQRISQYAEIMLNSAIEKHTAKRKRCRGFCADRTKLIPAISGKRVIASTEPEVPAG